MLVGTPEFQQTMIKDMGNVGIGTPRFHQIMLKDMENVVMFTRIFPTSSKFQTLRFPA